MIPLRALCTGACVAAVLSAAGCALSPQVVRIAPAPEIGPGPAASGEAVALEITDRRGTRLVGRRGGVYAETATITTGEDITAPLRDAIERGLRERGFVIYSPAGATPRRLRVAVLEIAYETEGGKALGKVKVRTALSVSARNGNRTFTSRYETRTSKDVLAAPDEPENERLINENLAKSLERLLADPELIGFLSG